MPVYRRPVIAMLAGLLFSGFVQASEACPARETMMKAAILHQQDALLTPWAIPACGPASAQVVGNPCILYRRMAPVLALLMKTHPRVCFVFKTRPAPGGHSCETIQKVTTSVDGPEAHPDRRWWGARKVDALARTLTDIGDREDARADTDDQARSPGPAILPALVIMPVSHPTTDSITVITGMANINILQAAIEKASQHNPDPGR